MGGELQGAASDTPQFLCGNQESFGDGTGIFLLQTTRPTWWLDNDLPWMPRAKFEACIDAAWEMWSKVCDVIATRAKTAASANFVYKVRKIDGPMGILARMQLPNPQLKQQLCEIDLDENALADWLPTIIGHENGHGLALQHFDPSPPPELMEPSLNRSIRTPQETESALVAKWYGPPKSVIVPPGPVIPEGVLVCTSRMGLKGDEVSFVIDVEDSKARKAHLEGKQKLK